VTTQSTPTAGPPSRRSKRPRVSFVGVPFLAGLVALIVALVLVVVIRRWDGVCSRRCCLWISGVAALIVSANGIDRSLSGRTGRWSDEVLHCLSASIVMLAVALVLGAFIPPLLGISASASLFAAIGCDVVIGFVAGILMLVVIVPSGLAGGELSYCLRQIR
jgi:hypothetical protein